MSRSITGRITRVKGEPRGMSGVSRKLCHGYYTGYVLDGSSVESSYLILRRKGMLSLTNPEHLGPAGRAHAVGGGPSVFHGDPLRILHLSGSSALHAIGLHNYLLAQASCHYKVDTRDCQQAYTPFRAPRMPICKCIGINPLSVSYCRRLPFKAAVLPPVPSDFPEWPLV